MGPVHEARIHAGPLRLSKSQLQTQKLHQTYNGVNKARIKVAHL